MSTPVMPSGLALAGAADAPRPHGALALRTPAWMLSSRPTRGPADVPVNY